MDLKEIVVNTRDWVDSAQDREYSCEFVNEPPNSITHGVIYEDPKTLK